MKKSICFSFAFYGIPNAFAQQKSNDVTTSLQKQSNTFKKPSDLCNDYVC